MSRDETASRFVRALAGRDWNGLRDVLEPSIQFRALVPRGLREASTSADASGLFRGWFGKADALELESFAVEPLLDTLRVSYRLRLHEDRWYRVEQQAFCVVSGDRIQRMDLLCSGFRPEDTPA